MKFFPQVPHRINQSGIAHFLVPVLIVVLIACAGIFTIVASHADPMPGYTRSQKKIDRAPAGSRKRIVLIAQQQLGYAEKPVNKVKYFDWAGDQPGAPGPWCAVFATWVWHAAGVRLNGQPYPKQPGVAQVRDTGKASGRFHAKPHTGDAILYGRYGGDHIGIVERVSGSKISVIEGNAGLKNQADEHVIRRNIDLKNPVGVPHGVVYGFVSPPSR